MFRTAHKLSHNRALKRQANNGFTLVELLVVIAIIVALAAIVTTLLNPIELMKRGRDTTRLQDLSSVNSAIATVSGESGTTPQATLCHGITLDTSACSGTSTATGAREVDGTGWVKVDFDGQTTVNFSVLPVDPTNTTGSTGYHYTYCAARAGTGNGYVLVAALEADQNTTGTGPSNKVANDGGTDTTKYEIGTDLDLLGTSGCTY